MPMDAPLFFTLGMFILDEIHHSDPQIPCKYNIIGGGGTFGALGARIITPEQLHCDVKLIIDKGSDFPSEVQAELDRWNIAIDWREDSTRLTTRGWNMYNEEDGSRDFKYMTPKLRVRVDELYKVSPRALHMICSLDRVISAISILRSESRDTVLMYEPVPYDCLLEKQSQLLKIIPEIDILSPNAKEAASVFGMVEPTKKSELEALARKFLPYLHRDNKFETGPALVLRCGALGCYTLPKRERDTGQWYPSYHQNSGAVVDPTGCGNTFIGAFVTGFVLSGGDYRIASICGNVASGVCIENLGMPQLTSTCHWNGIGIQDRIAKYCSDNNMEPFILLS